MHHLLTTGPQVARPHAHELPLRRLPPRLLAPSRATLSATLATPQARVQLFAERLERVVAVGCCYHPVDARREAAIRARLEHRAVATVQVGARLEAEGAGGCRADPKPGGRGCRGYRGCKRVQARAACDVGREAQAWGLGMGRVPRAR